MATNFSPCKGSYVLNQFPSNVMFGMNGFHVSASGAIQGHHGPLVFPQCFQKASALGSLEVGRFCCWELIMIIFTHFLLHNAAVIDMVYLKIVYEI